MRLPRWLGSIIGVALASAALPAPIMAREELRLERVVMLMRHGVRPPTSAHPVPADWTREAWPSWPVGYGLLTPHGAAGVRLLGAADRAFYRLHGLIGDGCPPPGAIRIAASAKPRAFATAENWRDTLVPGCDVPVDHPADGMPDPLFHPLEAQPATFDGEQAWRDAVAANPGDLATALRPLSGELLTLARVLDCRAPACPLLTAPSGLKAKPHGRPGLFGPADVASTASQTFLLEYLEGMPMAQVGWGRLTRPQIERLLRFHPLEFRYTSRPRAIATATAGPLARAMMAALADPSVRIALFAGHDTNIADLGGLLDLHWRVPSYPADDIPPGSALGFEVWRRACGAEFVRAFFRSQTMDDLRELQPLGERHAPYQTYLPIPNCGDSTRATACSLAMFSRLVPSW